MYESMVVRDQPRVMDVPEATMISGLLVDVHVKARANKEDEEEKIEEDEIFLLL